MAEASTKIVAQIADELGVREKQVRQTLRLLDEGNTVPFIARYRKEQTGGLDEREIRDVSEQAEALRALEERRETIRETIREQDNLTEELREQIENASTRAELEDLYAPYRPRRQTRASRAREAGLEPVAECIREGKDPRNQAKKRRTENFSTMEEVLQGARDILAEEMADRPDIRRFVRKYAWKKGRLVCSTRRGADGDEYEMYTDFSSPLDALEPHQILAIRRGESEKELSAGLELNDEFLTGRIVEQVVENDGKPVAKDHHRRAIEDGYDRLLHPAIERDVRGTLEERADEHAIDTFSVNLKNLLLQPPMPEVVVLGVDPGLRTGCKLAVVSETGECLETGTCYVHDQRRDEAIETLRSFVDRHEVDRVAIGNGTASRQAEEAVAEALSSRDRTQYAIIDEAGASVYSASDVARKELPELDVSLRGAVSIARRLQDPLAELVKIDPQRIGVGMYQHDVNEKDLRTRLEAVVEDVVNSVGVDLNSASVSLLEQVAGIGPTLAERIVTFRSEHGAFSSLEELKDVRGMGAKTFKQCAGFLRIRNGENPLDHTGVHPENQDFARAVLSAIDCRPGEDGIAEQIERLRQSEKLHELMERYDVGEMTGSDVLDALETPGRDPREDVDPPDLRTDVRTMDDLQEGMEVEGTVRNVVDFGAFVDIGVKEDGLLHISEMADRYVDDPHEEVGVGDQVQLVITSIDQDRGEIGLSRKQVRD